MAFSMIKLTHFY